MLLFFLLLLLLLLFSSSLSNPATSKADLLIPRNAPAPRVSVPPKAKAPESTCRSASDIAGSEEKYTHTFPTQEQVTTKPFFLRSRPLDQGSAAGGVAPLIWQVHMPIHLQSICPRNHVAAKKKNTVSLATACDWFCNSAELMRCLKDQAAMASLKAVNLKLTALKKTE